MPGLSILDSHAPRDRLVTLGSSQAHLAQFCCRQQHPFSSCRNGSWAKLYPPDRRKVQLHELLQKKCPTAQCHPAMPSKVEAGEGGGEGLQLCSSFHPPEQLLRAQKRAGWCWRRNFPGPTSKRSKDMKRQEINARAARTPAQNVRQDCANGEQNHISFFILGVPTCFAQSTQKFYAILKPGQKKRLSSHLHPSSLFFPHLVALKKGEWSVDTHQPAHPELAPTVPMSPVNEAAFFLLPCSSTVVSLL